MDKKPDMVEMKVAGLTIDPFTNMPIVILKDLEGSQAVPIWIGIIEASAIATELEQIEVARPMTHDLFRNVLKELGVRVRKVEVNDLRDNTFFATIHLEQQGRGIEMDARPSDSIALALRTGADIWVSRKVIDKSRKIDLQDIGKDKLDKGDREKWLEILENMSPEDFGKYKM